MVVSSTEFKKSELKKMTTKKTVITSAVKKIDIEERCKTFIKKLAMLTAGTAPYARCVRTERDFIYKNYPAFRSTKSKFTMYRNTLLDSGLFHHTYEENVVKLVERFPHLKDILDCKTAREARNFVKVMRKGIEDKTSEESKVLKTFKIAVHAYYLMKLKDGIQESITKADKAQVVASKADKITVSIDSVKEAVTTSINDKSIYKRAVALALCCGRRPVELFLNAVFKRVGTDKLMFTGQAKDKGTGVRDSYQIPLLFTTQSEFLKSYKEFRLMLRERGYEDLTPVQFNNRVSKELSKTTRKLLVNDNVTYYSCRSIYAEYACAYVKDNAIDKQIYTADILGHDHSDVVTALSYEKVFLVEGVIEVEKPKQRDRVLPLGVETVRTQKVSSTRLKKLEKLTATINETTGKAVKGLHEWILNHLKDNPALNITQTYITKNKPTSRPAIKKYLELIGDLATN